MTNTQKLSAAALAVLGLALGGCKADIDAPPATSAGSADFSRYIAVGNSLTAGYADGGLYREGQINSYPNILASQFALAGGGAFVQPLFTEAQSDGSGYLSLSAIVGGSPVTSVVNAKPGRRIPFTITPVVIPLCSPAGATSVVTAADKPLYTKFTDPINNLGVPGIRLADIQTPGYGSALGNPFFERITPDAQGLQTYLQRVQATVASIKPTFFTTWLGNNDVLGYATAGGASGTLTNPDTFRLKTIRVLNVLTSGGAKGLISTIPDVTAIPFFTTVGPGFKATLAAKNVPGLVIQTGAALGGPASGNRRPIATADIKDATGGRQLFTLTSAAFLSCVGTVTDAPWRYVYAQSGNAQAGFPLFLQAYGIDTTKPFGVTAENPIPSAFVLDDLEQAPVQTATDAFNASIRAAADAKGLAVFDANTFFKGVAANGYATNGVANTAGYISGNLFSLDGVHPTPRGYAAIANQMLDAINAKYGSTFRGVDANLYRGVLFPRQ